MCRFESGPPYRAVMFEKRWYELALRDVARGRFWLCDMILGMEERAFILLCTLEEILRRTRS